MLTPEQISHNARLDMEIAEDKNHNKLVEELNNYKMKAWKNYLEENPDCPFKSCHGLDLSSPKRVIGIRYV